MVAEDTYKSTLLITLKYMLLSCHLMCYSLSFEGSSPLVGKLIMRISVQVLLLVIKIGCSTSNGTDELKVKKGLKRLKQCPRLLHEKLRKTLKDSRLTQLEACDSVFIVQENRFEAVIMAYIHDFEILSAVVERVNFLKVNLNFY